MRVSSFLISGRRSEPCETILSPGQAPQPGRRDVLKVMMVGGAAVPFAMTRPAAPGSSQDGGDAVVGTVRATADGRLTLAAPDGDVEVALQSGARMYSGAFGAVTSARQFLVGDRVAAQGERAGRVLRATSAGSVYTPLTARVTRVSADGSVAETSAGLVELHKGRLPFTSPQAEAVLRGGSVAPGMMLQGLAWQDPRTGERYLMIHPS